MRHGNACNIFTRKYSSDDKKDGEEDDSGAAGGSVGGSTPTPKEGISEDTRDLRHSTVMGTQPPQLKWLTHRGTVPKYG